MIEIIVVISLFAILSLGAAISVSAARRIQSHQDAARQFIHLEQSSRALARRFHLPLKLTYQADKQTISRSLDEEHTFTETQSSLHKSVSIAPFRVTNIRSARTTINARHAIHITDKGYSPSYAIELMDKDANEKKVFFITGLTGQVIELKAMSDADALFKRLQHPQGSGIH